MSRPSRDALHEVLPSEGSRSSLGDDSGTYYSHSDAPHTPVLDDSYNVPLLSNRSRQDRYTYEASPSGSFRKGKRPPSISTLHNRARSDSESDLFSSYPPSVATDDTFVQTPPASSLHKNYPSPERDRRSWLSSGIPGFEAPEWKKILFHCFLCAISLPFLVIVRRFAQDKTLFWSRAIVGSGCGFLGFWLGFSLVELGKSFLEAATWATLIHQSNVPISAPGIRLKDLASTAEDPTSMWAGCRLMWARYMFAGTARSSRREYDKRPWTIFILLFLLASTLAGLLPFLLGRILDIKTVIKHDPDKYEEVAIYADLSPSDIDKAAQLNKAFKSFQLTWTISPFAALAELPPYVVLKDGRGEDVYFAEVTRSQLLPDGSGFGTFAPNVTRGTRPDEFKSNDLKSAQALPGNILRFPRWGIRIHCQRLSNGNVNIIPQSGRNFTYVFTPRDDLRSLFASFNRSLPAIFEASFNESSVFKPNDTIPLDRVNINSMTHFSSSAFEPNGLGHSFKSFPVDQGNDGFGWTQVEVLLVRLNTTFTPNGDFQVYDPPKSSNATSIGYDATVCVELFEPYVVGVYNNSNGIPQSLMIVDKAKEILPDPTAIKKGGKSASQVKGVKTALNSTGLFVAYEVLHDNSNNQIIKDNGRDGRYVPSPTLISYTGGSGPLGYTQLSPKLFAEAKAKADCSNLLPYLAGSGKSLAWSFQDRVLTTVYLDWILAIPLVLFILVMGVVAGLFVPKLPLDVPRRGFTLYSWWAAFQGNELLADRTTIVDKQMNLKEIEEEIGDLKFRYSR
ncbi:hypothetical protein VNI00_010138 [Paramarasmius palmivorus]|uniref:Uncharacterized protein n=1 Tax=Paramarasmius palmivorus TaxID=297713 RepID=A0AAW0CHD8_9AGAR